MARKITTTFEIEKRPDNESFVFGMLQGPTGGYGASNFDTIVKLQDGTIIGKRTVRVTGKRDETEETF